MPLRAPDQLQSYPSSDHESAQSKSRQQINWGCNVVNTGECSSPTRKGGLPALESIYQGHPLFLQSVSEQGSCQPSLFREQITCHSLVFFNIPGDTHPIIEVRASFECVLECLSEPFRQIVERLIISCGFGGQYITIAVTSSCQFRSLTAPCLPCNLGGASNIYTTCFGFQSFLCTRIDTPAALFEHLVCSYSHLISKCRPWWVTADLCAEPSHARGQKGSACH